MYFAKVGKVERTVAIPGADRIQVSFIYSTPCITSTEVKAGDTGILFPEGGQLAPWYLSKNNLYRDSNLNEDKNAKGYFEEKGRVRAQPFRGAKSEGLFMPISSLGDNIAVADGDEITEVDGKLLCWKYIREQANQGPAAKKEKYKKFAIKVQDFHEHQDTKQWRFVKDYIDFTGCTVTLTEKLHGTSGRYGNHKAEWCPVELFIENKIPDRYWKFKSRLRKFVNKIRFWPMDAKYDLVVGSRRVVITTPDKVSFHGSEKFRYDVLEQIKDVIEPGVTIYGEITGVHPETKVPFMPPANLDDLKDKNIAKKFNGRKIIPFTYIQDSDMSFFIYRITKDGTDLSWEEIKQFCIKHDLRHVPEIHTGPGFMLEYLRDLDVSDVVTCPFFPHVLREGVVIRVDRPNGQVDFYKEKCYAFKVCEGILKEKEGDIEDES